MEYVLRRANGYFIYSTVEGVSIAHSQGFICNIEIGLATCCHTAPMQSLAIAQQ